VAIFGIKKILVPSKSLDFNGETLEMALGMAFPATKTK
jgi:hypothetical protein